MHGIPVFEVSKIGSKSTIYPLFGNLGRGHGYRLVCLHLVLRCPSVMPLVMKCYPKSLSQGPLNHDRTPYHPKRNKDKAKGHTEGSRDDDRLRRLIVGCVGFYKLTAS